MKVRGNNMTRKKAHVAYWYLPSITGVQYPNTAQHTASVLTYVLGAHLQRNREDLFESVKDVQKKDLMTKFNFTVMIHDTEREKMDFEAFPIIANYIPQIILQFVQIKGREIYKQGIALYQSHVASRTKSDVIYIERNLHQTHLDEFLLLARKNDQLYQSRIANYTGELSRIRWLKGSLIHGVRRWTRKGKLIQNVDEFFCLGVHNYNNIPVIGLAKSYGPFYYVIPLFDNGVSFIANLIALVKDEKSDYFIRDKYLRRTLYNLKDNIPRAEFVYLNTLAPNMLSQKIQTYEQYMNIDEFAHLT